MYITEKVEKDREIPEETSTSQLQKKKKKKSKAAQVAHGACA